MNDGPAPDAVEAALAALPSGAQRDAPLGALTTYRVGGTAAVGFTAETDADLVHVAAAADASGLPVLVVGRGSNLLVADAGFAGIAVSLGPGFAQIEWPAGRRAGEPAGRRAGAPDGTPAPIVGAGAAVPLPALARQSAARGLGGLEWAVGIPGSVGGAVRMNAGGHGGDIAACIESATVFDLRTGRSGVRGPDDLALGYRTSAVGPDDVVVGARLRCAAVDPDRARSELDAVVAWRRENQPGGQNAGSVFANPSGPAGPSGEEPGAGALIDGLGLKGHRLGTAHVSEVHANFIVADPDGSADDVAELIDFLADRVLAATGTRLRVEVRRVGFGAGDG